MVNPKLLIPNVNGKMTTNNLSKWENNYYYGASIVLYNYDMDALLIAILSD